MTDTIGSENNPLRVAVVGSGPAGFYATEELLKQADTTVTVDLYDRLPTPYGLVRGGVAPDHQKIKSVIKLYERTAGRPGFRFFGNVAYGQDITLEDLLRHYHQVLFSTGAETDRKMGIPGEDLPGSWPATQFVGWYNGHPDYRHLHFDLRQARRVAVIGNGNVAVDVIRILAKSHQALAGTDIADYALEALKQSAVREVYMLGRRGPAQAAFTNPEIRELTQIEGCDFVVRPEELELDEPSRDFLDKAKDPAHQRNMEILRAQIDKGEGTQPRKIRARFFVSPVEVLGDEHVAGLRLERNRLVQGEDGRVRAQGTGEHEELEADLVFRSIGYKGLPLPDLPFDERGGTVPNVEGRVVDADSGQPLPRLYVAGWIKRGPSGVIGTNKPDAIATVRHMLEDTGELPLPADFQPDPGTVDALLRSRNVPFVRFQDWQKLDRLEVERGRSSGRPRVKFTSVEEMLAQLQ